MVRNVSEAHGHGIFCLAGMMTMTVQNLADEIPKPKAVNTW